MDSAFADRLYTGDAWFLPGVNYVVIKEFVDNDGEYEQVIVDLHSILNEVFQLLRNETLNNSLQPSGR